jgi:hypothetical protein
MSKEIQPDIVKKRNPIYHLNSLKGNTIDKGKETMVEQFHTLGSFQNVLAWGDRKILEPIEEVADLESIAYNRQRKAIVRRTHKRKMVDVDSVVVYTT